MQQKKSNSHDKSRREFIKITSLASATLFPLVGTLAQLLGKKEEDLTPILGEYFNKDLEFHIVDNNLLNLHFYFIGVKKSGSYLIPSSKNLKSFMVVRLPQMHLSEKGYWYDDWKDDKKRLPQANLSGYSYLAFEMWPDKNKKPNPNKYLKFTLDNVLNWNNHTNFELITLVEWFDLKQNDALAFADYTKCDEFNKRKVWHQTKDEIVYEFGEAYYEKNSSEPVDSFNYKKYKSLVSHFLDKNLHSAPTVNNFIPITLLEFPQGTVLVPISRDESGELSKKDTKPFKEFWKNKLADDGYIDIGYRKYEVWNNTLFYKTRIAPKTAGSKTTFKFETPSFRIAGLINDAAVVCPKLDLKSCEEANKQTRGFLPSLLDKTELAFLTQYAQGQDDFKDINFRDKKFDINELNGLLFTGLGIITHLRYYNEDAPKGIDLIEYEHIITEGRDIFIKVARIGVHNKNGKRYKHVIEGKRKIETKVITPDPSIAPKDPGKIIYSFPDGPTSFIELKQYCECIEKTKNYEFTDEEATKWNPQDFANLTFTNQTNVIFSPANANQPHFRRFTWREIRTIEKKRIPIDVYQDNPVRLKDPECVYWFWPIYEGTFKNPKYVHSDFDADDWDKGTTNLSTPFIFIRKSVIEDNNAVILKEIADSYFLYNPTDSTDPINVRRKIITNNKKIAFTPPLPVTDTSQLKDIKLRDAQSESRNKVHILETDFVETYYNINNSVGKLVNGIPVKFSEVRFPLLPQTLRAKVFIDHIRDLTHEKIPSMIQYHGDYLKHVFDEYTKPGKDVLGNGAKLILENTTAFQKNAEEAVNNTYQQIAKALNEAKSKLGNLAVPDIIPECISLEKLGITAPNEIKESIKKAGTVIEGVQGGIQKIASFNPRELLRGKLSDVCGLDLTAILDELLPVKPNDNQTPLFEINKTINTITDEIQGSGVYLEIKTKIDEVKGLIEGFKINYTAIAQTINGKEQELVANLKALSAFIPNSDELDSFIKSEFEQLRTKAFELVLSPLEFDAIRGEIDGVMTTSIKFIESEKNFLKEEFDSYSKELDDYFKYFIEEIDILDSMPDEIKKIEGVLVKKYFKEEIKKYYDDIHAQWTDFYQKPVENLYKTISENTQLTVAGKHVYYESDVDKSTASITYVLTSEKAKGNPLMIFDVREIPNGKLAQLENKINILQTFVVKNIAGNDFQKAAVAEINKLIIDYSIPFKAAEKKAREFQNEKLEPLSKNIEQWEAKIEEYIDATDLLPKTRDALIKVKGLVAKGHTYIDFLRKFDPYFYHIQQQRLQKETTDIKLRFEQLISDKLNIVTDKISVLYGDPNNTNIATPVTYSDYRQLYLDATIAFQKALKDYQTLGTVIPEIVRENFNFAKMKFNEFKFESIDKLKVEANALVSSYAASLKDKPEIKAAYEAIYANAGLINTIKAEKEKYEILLKRYLDYVKAEGSKAEQSIYDAVSDYIAAHPDEVEKVREAENIYRLLTSIKRQDLAYNWNTNKFRDINLGIVSFKKFSNPDTTLKVDVKATTFFTPGKFPPTIERVETYSENRFSNFGISFFNSVTVGFNEVSFIAGSNQSTHFDVKIKDVKFEGALSFVQAFESYLKTMGKGLILNVHGDHAALGYSLPIPDIQTPAFSFFNLSLNLDLRVYFDKRPLQFGFSLATAESKFGIAAGIYAGFGFFSIVVNPKQGIVGIDCALEAGAWSAIRIGPISGEVKLAFGFRYTKDLFGVRLEGYIVAEGRLSVWIIEVSARIYLGVVSQNSSVEGICTVTYSAKLGFIKKSFSGTFHKKIAGANSNNTQAANSKIARLHTNLKTSIYDEVYNDVSSKLKPSDKTFNRDVHSKIVGRVGINANEECEIVILPVAANEWKDFISLF